MKKAFTLIEMLVVVGIIAVLASIVLVNIRGATDAANATKCMSNMRSLFNAADSMALAGERYPLAGACTKQLDSKHSEPVDGWIACDRAGNVVPCYGTGDEDEDHDALARGGDKKFLKHLANNESVYKCPVFVKDHLVKRKCKPVFSYAMNAVEFESDKSASNDSFAGAGTKSYGDIMRADRTIMFAELPISQSCSYDPLAKPETCDATLKPKTGNPLWKGSAEEIGFVHQDKRKKYYGHVVFADGHVEKFMQPPASSSLKADMLTVHICSGHDVSFDDNGYRLVAEVEDEEE